jgi:hypothetical protein
MTSGPGSALIAAISAARSPVAIRVVGQESSLSVLENTILGMSFIGAAYACAECGQ